MEGLKSSVEIYDIQKDTREVIDEEQDHLEAPNWSRTGNYLILNSKGKLFRLDLKTKKKTYIDTGFADKCNNDHGISPDGSQIVLSHQQQGAAHHDRDFMTSSIFIIPIEGGTPKPITSKAPSFWHGWSPDGKTLVYTALRNGDFDIYSISVEGGEETRLTDDPGLDDGPDYSHHGKYIYYNSMRSGSMEIWRMRSNGDQKEQLTNDEYSNWFPHPSPNGKYFVYLAYLEDQGDRHPPMKNVALRLYDLRDNTINTLCTFAGGQGTINVPSWSPDGNKFAFVSYGK